MILEVPRGQKLVKIKKNAKKRSTGNKNMFKKRMRKKDTKKGAGPARTSADLSAPQIPCLSLPGLGKGRLGWLGSGWAGLTGLGWLGWLGWPLRPRPPLWPQQHFTRPF